MYKVDREERPDIDQTYLEAIHMFNNQRDGHCMRFVCLMEDLFGEEHTSLKKIMIMALLHGQELMRISEHYKRKKKN